MPDRTQPTRDAVVLERTVPAPPESVWGLWTDPDQFAAWYGPFGATITVHAMDVRVGGDRRLSMNVQTPDGERVMHFAGVHLEVQPHRLLSYTEAVVDAPGGDPHGAATEVQVRLEPADAGTRLTLTHLGIPAGSPGEMGWTMAFDKLEEVVRRTR